MNSALTSSAHTSTNPTGRRALFEIADAGLAGTMTHPVRPTADWHTAATQRLTRGEHAADLLRCAAATAYESADHLSGSKRDLAFSVVHLIEMARGAVERSLLSTEKPSATLIKNITN